MKIRDFLMIAVWLLPSVASADNLLTWTLPTETENGYALQPGDITAVTLYKQGIVEVVLPGDAVSFTAPGECRPNVTWTATATAFTLESQPSVSITMPVDEVGCRPKPPGGLSVSAQ